MFSVLGQVDVGDPTLDPLLGGLIEAGRYVAGRGFFFGLAAAVLLWLAARLAVRLREIDVAVTARIWFRYAQAATAASGLIYLLLAGGPSGDVIRRLAMAGLGVIVVAALGVVVVAGAMWARAARRRDRYGCETGRHGVVLSGAVGTGALAAWTLVGTLL